MKSGSTRSTPGISGLGNITPQSRTTRRPACSTTAQLRPISPSPPRNEIRTGSGIRARRRALGQAARAPQSRCGEHGARLRLQPVRGRAHRAGGTGRPGGPAPAARPWSAAGSAPRRSTGTRPGRSSAAFSSRAPSTSPSRKRLIISPSSGTDPVRRPRSRPRRRRPPAAEG